ncbi:MAG: hypothetical protein ACOY31_09540 [Bacillota bacterium]
MNKLPIDTGTLPEPLKSLADNLDPAMLEQFLTMYDPATILTMVNSLFSMFKNNLTPEQAQELQEIISNITSLIPQK